MGLTFRELTAEDESFFAEMDLSTTWESIPPLAREGLSREAVAEAAKATNRLILSQPGTRLLLAEDDETAEKVGLLWFGWKRDPLTGLDEGWVYSVSVVPERRGEGIGRRLMAEAERLAADAGFPLVGLMVSAHNVPAVRLYQNLGYETTNLIMRKRVSSRSFTAG